MAFDPLFRNLITITMDFKVNISLDKATIGVISLRL